MVHEHDNKGRKYAKYSQLIEGHKLAFDSGFSCLSPDEVRMIRYNGEHFWIKCSAGEHDLRGNLQGDKDTLLGFYHHPKNPPKKRRR